MFYIVASDEKQSILVLHTHSTKTFIFPTFIGAWRIVKEPRGQRKILVTVMSLCTCTVLYCTVLYCTELYCTVLWCHLVLVVSAAGFEGVGSTYQYSGLVSLCNNSDKILALLLQQCYKIITSNSHFALIWNNILWLA